MVNHAAIQGNGDGQGFVDSETDESPSPMLVIIAVLTLVIYVAILRPANGDNGTAAQQRQRQPVGQQQQVTAGQRNQRGSTAAASNTAAAAAWRSNQSAPAAPNNNLSEAAQQVLSQNTRVPPHVDTSKSSAMGIGGRGMLVDGIVAFRYIAHRRDDHSGNSTPDTDVALELRKDRAKVLSKMLTAVKPKVTQPPARGSTLVVGVQETELSVLRDQASVDTGSSTDPPLQRVVDSLASYYNVFLTIHKNESSSASSTATAIRNSYLPEHRIIPTSTSTGRIALVRQLQNVSWVIDFDEQVHNELTRFGYKVYIYDPNVGLGSHILS